MLSCSAHLAMVLQKTLNPLEMSRLACHANTLVLQSERSAGLWCQWANGIGVTGEYKNASLRPHVPNAHGTISTTWFRPKTSIRSECIGYTYRHRPIIIIYYITLPNGGSKYRIVLYLYYLMSAFILLFSTRKMWRRPLKGSHWCSTAHSNDQPVARIFKVGCRTRQ